MDTFNLIQTATVTLLRYVAVGLICYCLAWILYTRFFHPLRNIPGPFFASVSHYWMVSTTRKGKMEYVQRDLHARYGPLIRVAPNELACSDPNAIKIIYPTQNPLTKTEFYPIWGNKHFSKYPDHFSGTDEKLHAQRRRIVSHVYSLSNVLRCEPYIDKCSQLFVDKLGQMADSKISVDLGEWLQWYAFDVIGQLYFGQMFGFMERSHDHESYIASLDTLMPIFLSMAISPTYWRPFLLGSTIFSSEIRAALKAYDHIIVAAREGVAKRLKQDNDQASGRDIQQQLLDIVTEKGSKVDFSIGDVQKEAWVAIFAGSDTTAVALRATLYQLLQHPDIYRQVQEEIDDAACEGKLSETVKYSEATALPLLTACIKEAMRLHPSVGLTLPRFAPVGGFEVAGTYIPEGYKIGMNPAVVHYDKQVFGSDADLFNPARWLEGDVTYMEKHILTFGAGTRTCLGKNISMSEVYKLVPQILRHFRLDLADDADWKTHNLWFNKQTGFKVKIHRR